MEVMNQSELRFKNICLSKNYKINKSTREQDITEHWDFKVNNSLVDVKGAKRVSRSDQEYNYNIAWLEIQNVRGDIGWLKGKANFIALEQQDCYIIVKREDLLNWLRKKIINTKLVRNPKDALYRLYQRKNRKDIISMVKINDFIKDIKSWTLKE